MDDTTTATPPPTAASAAAVADAKVSPGPAHHHAAAMDNSSNLELVIKSSNQQYDDIVVKSDLLWTVRHLKKQLSIVYPGKPLIEDQKLIYSGKLLKDAEKLNEVIRNYKDVFTQKHIFHLVCASRNAIQSNSSTTTTAAARATTTTTPTATAAAATRNSNQTSTTMGTHIASSTDGLRQRNIGQQQNPTQQQQQQEQTRQFMPTSPQLLQQFWRQQQQQFSQIQAASTQTANNATQANLSFGGLSAIPTTTTPALPYGMPGFSQPHFHAVAMYNAWLQQTYAQYMQQMMHGAETAAIPPNPYLQQLPYVVPFAREGAIQTPVITPATFPGLNAVHNAAATSALPSADSVAHERQPAVAAAEAPAAQADGIEQAVAAQPAGDELAAQRRFPNIQEEPENRDWLENFFALTRLAIFVTILYFNSSPLRCLLVVLIASAIYLYHIGVLRRRRERNNNNINRNNNAAAEAAAQIQRFMDEQNQAGQPGAAAEQANHPPNNEAHEAVDGNAAVAAAAAPDAVNGADVGVAASAVGVASNGIATVPAENSATVISIVRTFVVTFFTSLLPEAPAV